MARMQPYRLPAAAQIAPLVPGERPSGQLAVQRGCWSAHWGWVSHPTCVRPVTAGVSAPAAQREPAGPPARVEQAEQALWRELTGPRVKLVGLRQARGRRGRTAGPQLRRQLLLSLGLFAPVPLPNHCRIHCWNQLLLERLLSCRAQLGKGLARRWKRRCWRRGSSVWARPALVYRACQLRPTLKMKLWVCRRN